LVCGTRYRGESSVGSSGKSNVAKGCKDRKEERVSPDRGKGWEARHAGERSQESGTNRENVWSSSGAGDTPIVRGVLKAEGGDTMNEVGWQRQDEPI